MVEKGDDEPSGMKNSYTLPLAKVGSYDLCPQYRTSGS